ncbi:ABC transporter permease [Paenibacillus caui]|uniref:ABC transporter permease n=1 Tax=Paenibacillus caui TaxID=2873927 RepID=UPI001CAA0BF8|nr:ABC-2 family transporter protein [Paenibacillus caui]
MLYFTLASKAYARNLQYRGAHMVHNLASASFGFMYACLWIGLGQDHSLGEYGTQGMVSYIAFNQAALWVTTFLTNGLGIPLSVRTGHISLDLMRPVHLFSHLMAREWGQIAYQFVYKSIPIYVLYYFVFQLHFPGSLTDVVCAAAALAGAAYLSICMNFLIGASALWTTESSWLYWGNYAMSNLLAGFFIPLEWLPDWLERIAWLSPYPYLLYVPTRLYLGYGGGSLLWGTLLWCVLMTLVCLMATALLRQKVEVQGG